MKKPTPKPASRKAAPRKAAAKKAAPKKAPAKAKKAAVKKAAPAKKPVKKAAVKKAAPKKTAAKKAAPKKAAPKKAIKKAPVKKAALKKAPVKKTATKKTAPKKDPVRKIAPAKKTAPARKPRAQKAAVESPSQKALAMITKSLDDDQADNIAVIDLAGKSAMADYMVIASGRNPRHIGAMAQHLREKIKALGGHPPAIEGLATADWVLVDQGDVIIHLFRPEVRQLYNLEKMWGAAMGPENGDADPRHP